MKLHFCMLVCLLSALGGALILLSAVAGETAEPRITLTAANQPLGEILDNITGETGYRFNLNDRWEEYPVSATIRNLPLEQGLKRLLRSLNHTIIWESDKVVTIKVFGKAEAGDTTGPSISFAAPPQEVPETPEPAAEVETQAVESQTAETPEAVDEPEQTAETQAPPRQATERQLEEGGTSREPEAPENAEDQPERPQG